MNKLAFLTFVALLTISHVVYATEPVVLFKQPPLDGIVGNLYVQARIPEGKLCLISWQKNPATKDGLFIPVDWNVGEKTGLEITEKRRERQAGMVNRQGRTAAQVLGTTVGAYLNSEDLSGDGRDAEGNPLPGSGGYKMMVTPEIRFLRKPEIRPFAVPSSSLVTSFDLQVPVALDEQRAGSHCYVNPCFVFIDPKTNLKLSYIVVTFSNGYRVVKESVAYDDPSHSWMLHTYMTSNQQWVALESGSEEFQSKPWRGWKHFSFRVTPRHLQSALSTFRERQPNVPCSTNPGDYVLQSFHLNAELKYQKAHAELGWSMRDATISMVRQ